MESGMGMGEAMKDVSKGPTQRNSTDWCKTPDMLNGFVITDILSPRSDHAEKTSTAMTSGIDKAKNFCGTFGVDPFNGNEAVRQTGNNVADGIDAGGKFAGDTVRKGGAVFGPGGEALGNAAATGIEGVSGALSAPFRGPGKAPASAPSDALASPTAAAGEEAPSVVPDPVDVLNSTPSGAIDAGKVASDLAPEAALADAAPADVASAPGDILGSVAPTAPASATG